MQDENISSSFDYHESKFYVIFVQVFELTFYFLLKYCMVLSGHRVIETLFLNFI